MDLSRHSSSHRLGKALGTFFALVAPATVNAAEISDLVALQVESFQLLANLLGMCFGALLALILALYVRP